MAVGLSPARADTLADAIVAAYESNPDLEAQRAQQQVTDEGDIQARAGWRPTVSLQGTAGYSQAPQSDPFSGTQIVSANSGSATLSIQQPIYTGGRTLEAVRAAKYDILAGHEQLRSTEASVLAAVISVYTAILYDSQALGIRQNDVAVFQAQVAEAAARLKDGDATKTDVAQSEAQLAASRELLALAEAQLQADRAAYTTVVGAPPGTLADVGALPGLPKTVEAAFDLAEQNNPDLARAQQAEAASGARIAEARAARRPYVAVQWTAGYGGPVAPLQPSGYLGSVAVQVAVTQPIYDAGLINSGVRQALARNTVDRIGVEAARRNVIQAVAQSWNACLTASADIITARAGLTAAETAFKGSQIEYRSGLRTTTDVLLAEEALSNANLAVAQAVRDETLAQASLLAATGALRANDLVQGMREYDPAKSLRARERSTELPWERLLEGLDQIGAPSDSNRKGPPRAPAPPPFPALETAPNAPPSGDSLVSVWPTATTDH